ncbi:hypothetical protein DQW09_27815 (plasmid) [Ensifer adhaerens]|nr:hypothetical protein DQW09_27815 [Ensifer adhaerens]
MRFTSPNLALIILAVKAKIYEHLQKPACGATHAQLHVSFNRLRLKGKNMQKFKVLQRPLHVS